MKIYLELRDWWIGYYRGDTYHYVCPLPCVVIRWPRREEQDQRENFVRRPANGDALSPGERKDYIDDARLEVKAEVEKWFSNVDLDDLFDVNRWPR